MKRQYYLFILILLILLILWFIFYWYQLRPTSIKKECFNTAEMAREAAISADNVVTLRGMTIKRADYEKIFNDEYSNCLMKKGFK